MGLAKGIAIMPAVLDTAWPQRRGAGSPYEGLLFLHGLESNPGSSLQTEEEAGPP